MPKTIKFWTIDNSEDDACIVDSDYLQLCASRLQVETLSEDEISTKYGDKAVKREIVLKPNSYKLKHEIARLCQVDDEKLGKRHDPELVQAARAAACVSSWNLDDVDGKPAPVSVEGFENLAMNVAEYVDFHVYRYLAPEIAGDADFLGMWQSKLPPTANPPMA